MEKSSKKLLMSSCGGFLGLFLLLLFTQSHLFNFFLESFLGRIILIILILLASYIHKVFGVVVVLFLILIFNNNLSYFEGFEAGEKNETKETVSTDLKDASGNQIKEKIEAKMTSAKEKTDGQVKKEVSEDKTGNLKGKAENAKENESLEGFDIIGTENNLKRGKQSNSIPVNPFTKDSTNVTPFEGSSIVETFSAF